MPTNKTSQMDLEEAIKATLNYEPEDGTEQPSVFEQSVQARYLDEQGREIPNPVPLQPPVGYVKRPTIAEQMRQMIRQASYEASQMGAETEEEANDFDVGEDFDPTSPWEHDFDPDPEMEALIAHRSRHPRPAAAASDPSSVPAAPAGREDNALRPEENK